MSRAQFNYPTDDRFKDASAITASAEDSEYPVENIITENAANPAKLTTTTGWFVWAFDEKTTGDVLDIIYHYLDEGLTGVKIQANDSDSWATPAFEQTIEIPAKRHDGPSYQPWTHNVRVELEGLEDPDGYLFWRLVFEDANSQEIVIGRVMLQTARAIDVFHAGGEMAETDLPTNILNPTELDVLTLEAIGGPRRELTLAFIGTDLQAGTAPVQDAGELRHLEQSCNEGEHPFTLAIFDDTSLTTRQPLLVHFVEPVRRVHAQGGYQVWTFTVREVSRGLPFP